MVGSKLNGQVIDMSEKLGQNRFAACRQVEAYWENLRDGQLVPNRSQIDPRGIEDALNHAFILEAIGAGHTRIRIAGTSLNELMGMEVRGMPATSLFTPASREAFARAVKAVLESPAVMTLELRGEARWGQPALSARMILLPLKSDMGDITRILGCLETIGGPGKPPCRFELTGAEKRRLEQAEDRPLPAPKFEPTPQAQPGFAETPARFEEPAQADNSKWPSYLRVVKSDE